MVTRPVFPSPVGHRMERQHLGLNPESSHPPLTATQVRVETGPSTGLGLRPDHHWPPTTSHSTHATSCRITR